MIYDEPYDLYGRPDGDRNMLVWTHNLHCDAGELGDVWVVHRLQNKIWVPTWILGTREDAEKQVANCGFEQREAIVIERVILEPVTLEDDDD